MNILVADGDRHFNELLRGVIEREGHDVTVLDDAVRAAGLLGTRRFHLAVIGVALADAGAERIVRQVDAVDRGMRPAVLLLATADEGERRVVQSLMGQTDVRRVLRRPFSMFDLVDFVRELDVELAGEESADPHSVLSDDGNRGASSPTLGRLSEVALPEATTYLALDLATANLQRISRLWARRASGVLRLEGGPGRAEGWMLLGEGGPLDADGWELISAALHGGRLEFETVGVPGAGDHLGLGAMIFGRVRDPGQVAFLRQVGFKALLRVRADAPLATLPLSQDTRRLLDVVQPGKPLGELVTALGLDPAVVGPDLHALDQMCLLLLGEPVLPRRAGERPAHRTAADRRQQRLAEEPPITTPPTREATPRHLRTAPTPAAPPPPEPAAKANAEPPSMPSAPSTPSTPTDLKPGGLRSRRLRDDEDWPRVRRRLAERGRNWAARQAAQQGEEDREARVQRLRKDIDHVRGQPPAVVLGLPAGADEAMIHVVAERLRSRYAELAVDPGLPGEGHRLAEEMLGLVEQAVVRIRARSTPASARPEEERLLEAALDRMQLGRWSDALRLLRRARDLRLDHAGVLSALGEATMHDPDLRPAEREEEARGLLALAVHFAPEDGLANLRLARFLAERGELEAARAPARRAAEALPDDREAAALQSRIEAAASARS